MEIQLLFGTIVLAGYFISVVFLQNYLLYDANNAQYILNLKYSYGIQPFNYVQIELYISCRNTWWIKLLMLINKIWKHSTATKHMSSNNSFKNIIANKLIA